MRRSTRKSKISFRLPCTCTLSSPMAPSLQRLRQDLNNYFAGNGVGLECKNIAASMLYKVQKRYYGSWTIDVQHSTTGHRIAVGGREMRLLLSHIHGKVEGSTQDFVRIRVVCSHTHKAK